eukprot:3692843-Prymnesium_polylepis.1
MRSEENAGSSNSTSSSWILIDRREPLAERIVHARVFSSRVAELLCSSHELATRHQGARGGALCACQSISAARRALPRERWSAGAGAAAPATCMAAPRAGHVCVCVLRADGTRQADGAR